MINYEKKLFPKPQVINPSTGLLPLPSSLPYSIEHSSFNLLQAHIKKLGFPEEKSTEQSLLHIRLDNSTHPEGYRLKISPSGIILSAKQPVGAFRGLQTLSQIINFQDGNPNIPCVEIEDFPILKRRGFMLDASRCKVPTMETVYSLIDLLASLHINEFQLYIEHTFAFAHHQTVWQDSSPFTPTEIQEIDNYCKDRFIELVPNLNSFGHFERWLRHDDYKHMAECPDGFRRENPFIERDHGTTLKPNQASLDFIDSLYKEYLPNFSSDQFNVGMDEPWELGQGWSKEQIDKIGKDKVYLNHLDGIRKLVESHGKEMQFWADVLLENPENAKLLPSSASPVIWGYEPNHPFQEQAKAISDCNLRYCLAPGTGSWRSFSGRWPSAMKNIDSAITNAKKYGAEGILLTSWGDCGNHQPWATLYPALLYGAAQAWKGQPVSEGDLVTGMNNLLFNNQSSSPAQALLELGKLDQKIGSNIPNTSLSWFLLFAPLPEKLLSFLTKNHQVSQLDDGLEHLQSIKCSISVSNSNSQESMVTDEILLGIELSKHALEKGISLLGNRDWAPLPSDHSLFSIYENIWLSRARHGGLVESMDTLLHSATQAS